MAYKSKSFKEPANPVGNVAELFAGVGGFRIGLARAGWKTISVRKNNERLCHAVQMSLSSGV